MFMWQYFHEEISVVISAGRFLGELVQIQVRLRKLKFITSINNKNSPTTQYEFNYVIYNTVRFSVFMPLESISTIVIVLKSLLITNLFLVIQIYPGASK